MIDTNALLSATFAIISQFHTVVSIPPQQIPKGQEDIHRVVVGSPFSPLGIFVELRSGSSYQILDGAVRRYETVGSYYNLQDPESIPKFMGSGKLSSNDVFKLAVRTIERLTKQGSPRTNAPPAFGGAGQWRGEPIPFYCVTWPLTNSAQGHAARIEIDARTGQITYLHLPDDCFKDYVLAQQISNRVYTPDPPKSKKPPLQRFWACPTSNDVIRAIIRLDKVCRALGMKVDSHTNMADIDWDASCLATNAELSATLPVCQIRFTNGMHVTMFDGGIINCQLPDAYGNTDAPPQDPKKFFGMVNKRWRDLARNFEDTLRNEYGFTGDVFSNSLAVTAWGYCDAPVGEETFTPIMVIWLPYVDPSLPGHEEKIAATRKNEHGVKFGAEFDLHTGEIKSFGVYNPELTKVFVQHQKVPR